MPLLHTDRPNIGSRSMAAKLRYIPVWSSSKHNTTVNRSSTSKTITASPCPKPFTCNKRWFNPELWTFMFHVHRKMVNKTYSTHSSNWVRIRKWFISPVDVERWSPGERCVEAGSCFQEMQRCLQVDTRGRQGRGLNEWDQLLLGWVFFFLKIKITHGNSSPEFVSIPLPELLNKDNVGKMIWCKLMMKGFVLSTAGYGASDRFQLSLDITISRC